MVYLVSLVVYILIFVVGMKFAKSFDNTKSRIIMICLVGFCLQIFINYVFWGNSDAFGVLSQFVKIERDMTNFILLCITSIVCYGSLLTVLFLINNLYDE